MTNNWVIRGLRHHGNKVVAVRTRESHAAESGMESEVVELDSVSLSELGHFAFPFALWNLASTADRIACDDSAGNIHWRQGDNAGSISSDGTEVSALAMSEGGTLVVARKNSALVDIYDNRKHFQASVPLPPHASIASFLATSEKKFFGLTASPMKDNFHAASVGMMDARGTIVKQSHPLTTTVKKIGVIDDHRVVLGHSGHYLASPHPLVSIWDATRNKVVPVIVQDGFVTALDVSPGGKKVAVALSDYSVRIVDTKTTKEIKVIERTLLAMSVCFVGEDQIWIGGYGNSLDVIDL